MNKTKSLAQISSNMPIFKCRNWYLHTTERRIIKDGDFLEITPKSFDILQLLIERKGETVTKDEILGQVWNGSFVEESNLPVHISKLRRNLGETKTEPIIETAQGIGYRFIAPLKIINEEEWQDLLNILISATNQKSKNKLIFDSIAVLPFQNESKNLEIDYLVDGLTEDLINQISKDYNLIVVARNSVFRYKDQVLDPKVIGETLGVSLIITGRVRLYNKQLVVGMELTNVKNGSQLWGKHFIQFNNDLKSLQNEIYFEFSKILNTNLKESKTHQTINQSVTPESYRLLLKGRYLLQKRTPNNIYKAIKCFEKSISFDLENIQSYIEIIESNLFLYFSDYISRENVINQVEPIIELLQNAGNKFDSFHTMIGEYRMKVHWKFDIAEAHFLTALELNPQCLTAHFRYSDLLVITGRYQKALTIMNNLINFDPLSLQTYKQIGKLFYKMGRFELALNYLNDAFELESTDYVTLALIGAVYLEMKNYDGAISYFQKSLSLQFNLETLSMLGCAYARNNNFEKAKSILKDIELNSLSSSKHSLKMARIQMDLGNTKKALSLFENSIFEREVDLISIKSDPRFHPFSNSEPYFKLIEILKLKL